MIILNLIKDIASKIQEAELKKEKSVMFHYQVLKNADELSDYDALEFCRAVGMNDSYTTEFRKMIKLAKLMKRDNNSLVN